VKLEGVKWLLLDIYEGTDKGELHDFLGLTIHRDRPRCLLYIDQATYARKIVQGARLGEEAKFQSIPLPPNQHKDPPGATLTPEATARYRHTVGELLYLANITTGIAQAWIAHPSAKSSVEEALNPSRCKDPCLADGLCLPRTEPHLMPLRVKQLMHVL
jgi:hypothetical protein